MDPEGQIPSKEDLLAAIREMGDLDEESKKKLLESVLSARMEQGDASALPPSMAAAAAGGGGLAIEIVILLSLISLVLLVLGEIFLNFIYGIFLFFKIGFS